MCTFLGFLALCLLLGSILGAVQSAAGVAPRHPGLVKGCVKLLVGALRR